MTANLVVSPSQEDKKKRNVFLIFLIAFLLLASIGLGLYTIITQQISTKSRANEVATGSANLALSITPTQQPANALSCPVNGASCAWDAVEGATSYSYVITDKTTNSVVSSQVTSARSVNFTAIVEHTYECSVKAVNDCGTSAAAKGTNTCNVNITPTVTTAPTQTPTPTITPSPTLTLTPTPTPTITTTPIPNPSPTTTPTPAPSATLTPGPTSTPTLGPSATPTPTGTVVAQSATLEPTAAPAEPTLPAAGSVSSVYFMIISTILVATLFLVF